jgi:hypothetical protein
MTDDERELVGELQAAVVEAVRAAIIDPLDRMAGLVERLSDRVGALEERERLALEALYRYIPPEPDGDGDGDGDEAA